MRAADKKPDMKMLNVLVPSDLHMRIKLSAFNKGMTMRQYIEQILRKAHDK